MVKFEIHHQAEEVVYDDANGNAIVSPRGYWFRIVDENGTVAFSDRRHARRAGAVKDIRTIFAGMAGKTAAQIIVDRTLDS